MECPYCQYSEHKVVDSRNTAEFNSIRRRRECLKCGKRFTTFETIELTLQVYKRDERYEEFQKQKLINGMEAACRHTKISRDQVNLLATEITTELMQRQLREISTTELGEMVMQRLRKLDPIAYIRFACVYKRLKNIDELIEAINTIPAKDETPKKQNISASYKN